MAILELIVDLDLTREKGNSFQTLKRVLYSPGNRKSNALPPTGKIIFLMTFMRDDLVHKLTRHVHDLHVNSAHRRDRSSETYQCNMVRAESKTSSILVLASLLWLVSLHCVYSMGCSNTDEAFLKQRRIESLRANILAQLGMTDLSEEMNGTNTTEEPPSEEDENVRQAYEALVNATKGLENTRSKACQPQDFYAKPVTSFIGTMTPG